MVESNDPKVWFQMAKAEFDYACSDLEEPKQDFFAPTCFHFQQSAEKCLKAYILAQKKRFRKIHNLIELLQICAQSDSSFINFRDDAAILNPFYTDTRYPAHWPIGFTREDAEKAKEAAGKIIKFVKERVGF
ncbi:HEPN domain-containing protein [Candidatus Gottesmanbacteria bacterium]|nr:HEPN domain-containing protein [Candidatus Gottesmanbacteria bacterium]